MKTLITPERLQEGVDRLGSQLRRRYEGRQLTIVGILIGSIVFLSDLIRRIDLPLQVELVQARSYRGGTRAGPLMLNLNLLGCDLRGRDILLVDDIFDTGNTLCELTAKINELGPASVCSAVLLRKQGRSQVAMRPDFVGFEIPDAFVVGYGLDYRDLYRNLPYVASLEDSDITPDAIS